MQEDVGKVPQHDTLEYNSEFVTPHQKLNELTGQNLLPFPAVSLEQAELPADLISRKWDIREFKGWAKSKLLYCDDPIWNDFHQIVKLTRNMREENTKSYRYYFLLTCKKFLQNAYGVVWEP
ncbi:hypothetical protein CHS0354_041113 [Potamilus streckersoni]|uniref:Uncharacterized protein n=1 Tax=Potamilus streckersoni TaxID=2493646 RepID=A0AAE0VU37_9BIVA|nr:hypothetical protein CHS0354_041113 [Potamilus streckersoni]